ncbi:probable disease resistance RPP8-like protein 4 [Magnolia sinica]|uniref:probable disease resistance RPP8-like protein 4 n=1 Tax=Magnolia sinica TaxID=86752 RepID=UPI002657B360|nr:probable disease resistance RPP8-like protein 4 [Magnolia sinica]
MLEKPLLNILVVGFKLLRVMDLQNVELSSLPDEIGSIIHLRYLRLIVLQMLPSTITRLSNLQTFYLHCPEFNMQLDDICKMEKIRHLLLPWGCSISKHTPLHRLSNLQTLKVVKADSWIEAGLEKLTNLRDLEMHDLKMASSHSICKLVRLRSLSLITRYGCSIPAFESFSNHQHLYKMKLSGRLEKFLDLHEFPLNLTELHLIGSKIQQDPMGTLEKLPNLRILALRQRHWTRKEESYMGKEMVCSAGGFLQLQRLSIEEGELVEWRVEEGAMPNLRCLEINSCYELKMLPDGLQHVTTLKELKLRMMAKELEERVRENEGEAWYKIRHIPSIIYPAGF